ncbi:MAG: outer membrane protein assembly factor BamA [Deltaproteobacteria bacterium RIFCSPLOWO2_02_FULL_44_10]|nr:MAG: outer membrane protein assembly factor BamA [Deltaproteobacteria bacterium RIFCSPHIGHO2_02_FULL_44_16]OGQ46647.1 MAG: outer membrane protein assembly factor BamA [Deltaproteobacteria bacterium RIFCSPLOWO2_02_FULL_44_10]
MKLRFFIFFFWLFLLLPSLSFAEFEVIKDISFDGNIRTPEETILNTIGTKEGYPFDSERLRKDIQELYKLGQFSDVQVERFIVPAGVRLVYHFVENPLITKVVFTGNRKINDKNLEEEMVVRTYRPLNEHDVAKTIEKIRQKYANKGYYLAHVDYRLEEIGVNETKLVFEIMENQGIAVRKVQFIGNKVFSDDQLRAVMRTKKKGVLSFLTKSGKYEEEQLRTDKLFLTYHYLNHGYLNVKVSPPKVTISKDKRYIFVSFQIQEGEQYHVGEVDIEGDILTTKQELLSILKTKPKNIYSQRKLEEDILTLTERYGDEGYAFANIVPRTLPHDETLTADIHFEIEKGNRITIEKIHIFGNTTTRDKVVRRELRVLENDRYSERNLRESRRRLMQLGLFEEVNFATPRGSRDDTVILNVTVKERKTGQFNIQAGFSSLESFIFGLTMRKENFFGYGMSGELGAEFSKRRQFFTLSFRDPYFLDTKWSAGFSAYRTAYLFNDFRRTSTGGTLSLGHPFFERWSFDTTYRLEDVGVSSFSIAVPQFFRQNAGGLTSAFAFAVDRDTRDNRLIPTKGTYNVASFEVSGAKLGGDNDYFRTNYRSLWYQPVWKGIVFKTFGRIGHIKSLNDSPVPLFERFFTGGPNSLRGFFPNSLGPKLRIPAGPSGDDIDFVFGGDKLLLFTAEIEVPLIKVAGISAVTFYDTGNAFAEEESYSLDSLRHNYGFGLRWNSPIGPLRFEWGIPINPKTGEDDLVFNFAIGHFF